MKKYGNAASLFISPKQIISNKIDWNKQAIYGFIYPGKTFYKKETIYTRENYGNIFKPLSNNQRIELDNLVTLGDYILIKDSGDVNMARFINDILRVDSIVDGKIFGKLQANNIYIDLLPEMDILENISRGNYQINLIQYKERGRDR